MKNDDGTQTPREQEPFTVDTFRPDDGEGIVTLFRAVYGEGYPIRFFYDPAAITAANREGRYYTLVARTATGKVIGATHLYLSVPGKALYEWGVGLVQNEYRNRGVNKRLGEFLCNEFAPGEPRIETLFVEAVCNHPYMQKAIGKFNFVEMAIEVALMPARAHSGEKIAAGPGRVATMNSFRCYRPRPHRIFLPAPYEGELRRLYARFSDARDLVASREELPGEKKTGADLRIFDYARVARIVAPETGDDFGDRLDDLEEQALAKSAVVFQVWLNLTEPWAGAAVDVLRARGYFFGGPLPRWFDGDGLLMQKLLCPPDFEDIVLASDFSQELLEFIREDWRRAVS